MPAPTDADIEAVVECLRREQVFPLPGGHGVLLPELRDACERFLTVYPVERRAWVLLALLGEVDSDERWSAGNFVDAVQAWFNLRSTDPTIGTLARRYREDRMLALLMLHAVGRLCPTKATAARDAWWSGAESRLRNLRQKQGRRNADPLTYLTAGAQLLACPTPARSALASMLKEPDGAARLHARYFLRVLHASLAFEPPDKRSPAARRDFYQPVLDLLGRADGACDLCRGSDSVVQALQGLWLFREGSEVEVVGRDDDPLPACFSPHDCSPLPLHAQVRMLLDESVRPGLDHARQMALAIFDILTDPVRGTALGLRANTYLYLLGRLSTTRDYDDLRIKKTPRNGKVMPGEPLPALQRARLRSHASFFKAMAGNKLAPRIRAGLAVHVAVAQPPGCGLCSDRPESVHVG